MSEQECNCSFNNDFCANCRKAELETIMELQALRAWKEKARPFIEEALENFESYMYSQRLVAKGLTKENQETHAILTELIKGEEHD